MNSVYKSGDLEHWKLLLSLMIVFLLFLGYRNNMLFILKNPQNIDKYKEESENIPNLTSEIVIVWRD